MTDLEVPAYVAKCKCGCGGNIYAGVLTNDRVDRLADELADLIRNGYSPEVVTVARVRETPFGCQARRSVPA